MTSNEFIKMYWSQYILLEKEFTETLHYLTLDINNESAYSQAYAKLMLEIGSEVDVVFKEYCRILDPTFNKKYRTIDRYRDFVLSSVPDFAIQNVELINHGRIIQPWGDWVVRPTESPYWWIAYNTIKHNRTGAEEINGVKREGYKFATQQYVLLALGGLFQIMVYLYQKLATDEGKKIVTPMPGSRLFKLCGGVWDSISFYGDSAIYINDGHLIWETSIIHY